MEISFIPGNYLVIIWYIWQAVRLGGYTLIIYIPSLFFKKIIQCRNSLYACIKKDIKLIGLDEFQIVLFSLVFLEALGFCGSENDQFSHH